MSYLYRPTPVIVLSGKTVGHDGVIMRRLPAGTMHGYTPNMVSPALNSIGRRTLRGNPWLVASGTMGSFLGQDDGSGMDFSGAFASPTLPSPGIIDTGAAPSLFDFGGAFSSPTIPISSGGGLPAAPDIGAPILPAGSGLTTLPAIAAPAKPTVAAGTLAPVAAATPSILTSIANLFKPTTLATPMTAAQPGVYTSTTTTPSWFSQSSLIAGTPNSTVLIFGAAALVALIVLGGSKKR